MSTDTGPAAAASTSAVDPIAGREMAAPTAALRARGADRLDPVHLHFIEVLARRATAHHGAAREVLEARLARWVAEFERRLDTQAAARAPTLLPPKQALAGLAEAQPGCGPLAELVLCLDSPAQPPRDARGDHGPVRGTAAAGELKAVRHFRGTWSRLRVDRQLQLSMARLPENAGPLHTERLVLRALQALRDIAPAYLEHFLVQLDTLLWLDTAQVAVSQAPRGGARSANTPARKSARTPAGP